MKTTDTYDQARERAKARIIAQGKTYGQVAKELGYPRWLVSQLLCGVTKGQYGKAHQCAVALGIKPAPESEAA